MAELRRTFRPEFLNRIDEIVVFHPLGRNEIDRIVDLQLARLRKLLRERELDLELSPEARPSWAITATIPLYGARPSNGRMMRYVQDPLAKRVRQASFAPGDTASWWSSSRRRADDHPEAADRPSATVVS